MSVLSKLDEDIITFHILPHLDGKTLIILSPVSSQFHNLIRNISEDQWRNICISTWPSLITGLPCPMLSEFICNNNLPGGYRSFFSNAFPSIRPLLNNPPLPISHPRKVYFYYAIDIFIEPKPKPFYSVQSGHLIDTHIYVPHPLVDPPYFKSPLFHSKSNFNFITVKKEGYEDYLKQNLSLSFVVVDRHGKRVGSLFNFGCKPVSVRLKHRGIQVVFETVPLLMPPMRLFNMYTETVKCLVNVNCEWKGKGEDRFRVVTAYVKMKDMNEKSVWENHGAVVLLNAIGGRKYNN